MIRNHSVKSLVWFLASSSCDSINGSFMVLLPLPAHLPKPKHSCFLTFVNGSLTLLIHSVNLVIL